MNPRSTGAERSIRASLAWTLNFARLRMRRARVLPADVLSAERLDRRVPEEL